MADAHTRFRFSWLEGVQSDRGVTSSAFSVAFALAWHMNKTRGDAWPSRDALAERTGLSVRQVTEHLKTLQARGHIEARRRPNSSTVYLFKSRSDVPSTAVPDVRRTAGPRRPDGRFGVVRSGGEPQFRMCGEPQPNPLNVNPLKEPIESHGAGDLFGAEPETPTRRKAATASAIEADFAEWWTAYPSSKAQPRALKAYKAARKKGVSHAELLRGAQAYAASRAGQDPQYTRHGATWLNDEGWTEQPSAKTAWPQSRQSASDMAAEALELCE